MTKEEIFQEKREVYRKWLEQFTADEIIKLLADAHDMVMYKQSVECTLGRNPCCGN